MRAKLLVIGGKANREEIKLKLPAIVGRSRQAGVCIAHPTVSRQHCELYEEGGKIYVRDLGSLNGTLVAESQVQRLCLEHGDTLTIGPLTFQVIYEHLGAPPAPAVPKTDEDSAIGAAPSQELAQTMVDLPRIGAGPLEDLAAPAADLSDDDGFDLALPTEAVDLGAIAEEPLPPGDEVSDKISDDVDLRLFAGDHEGNAENADDAAVAEPDIDALMAVDDDSFDLDTPALPAVEPSSAIVADVEELKVDGPEVSDAVDDDAEFDLSPPPESMEADAEDDFLAFLGEPTATPDVDELASSELAEGEPAAVVDSEPSLEPVADDATDDIELDWLNAPAIRDDEEAKGGGTVAFDPSQETIDNIDDATDALSFEDVAGGDAAAPIVEVPVAETPPEPKKQKAKRGFWPFGRKGKAEPAAAEPAAELDLEPVEAVADDAAADLVVEPELAIPETVDAAPVAAAPDVSKAADETVVMDALELSFDDDAPSQATAVDINFTRELAHEKTLVIEDSAVTDVSTGEGDKATKKKRGFFSFGKKSKAVKTAEAEVAPEPIAEVEESPEVEAVETLPQEEKTEEAPAAGAVKKRAWWPFAKKAKATESPETPPEAVTPKAVTAPAPLPPPGASPNPESFEFSADELMDLTAETAPPAAKVAPDPQALAADEILDFELDLPLHDSSAAIQPILSDAPPPTTGADDDDFLDFLAEELPGAKPGRGAG